MRADMKTFWGVGPRRTWRLLPQALAGNPLPPFNEPAHIGYALMTPGVADATYAAIQRLAALKPRAAKFTLALNLHDPAQNRVVQTAVQAALATAPASMREMVAIASCEAPGAEISARFEVDVSPARLKAIYRRLAGSRAARLKRKPKHAKRAPREVQAS